MAEIADFTPHKIQREVSDEMKKKSARLNARTLKRIADY